MAEDETELATATVEERTPYNPHEARAAAKAAEVPAALVPPVPLGIAGQDLPAGFVHAGDLGPGDVVLIPGAIASTVWSGQPPNEQIWLKMTDGTTAGPFSKDHPLRTA